MAPTIRGRVRRDGARARRLLADAFDEDHTTAEVARSFGLGVFITMLPTLGVGFVVFLVLAAVFDRLSKVALVASAVVFNPVVKWGVYGLSFGLGVVLLGPVEGVAPSTASLTAAPDVAVRLVVGNVVLAVVAAVPSYVLAYRFLESHRERARRVVDAVGDHVEQTLPGTGEGGDPPAAE